jgi:hypothetical protein
VWKVLRETYGERFVGKNKICGFEGEFVRRKKEIAAQRSIWRLRTSFM